jgi:hypothetical protein
MPNNISKPQNDDRISRYDTKPIRGHWGSVKFQMTSDEICQKLFNTAPVCEVCGHETAISLACFDGFTNWKFCGACTSEEEFYTIPMADFFARPASVLDWLAHMSKKKEMDWESFGKMMLRLREATGSKGGVGPNFPGSGNTRA